MEHLYLMYILDNFYTFLTHRIHVLDLPSPAPTPLYLSYLQTATQPGWAIVKHGSYFCHWKQLFLIPPAFHSSSSASDSYECCAAVLALPSPSSTQCDDH